MTSSDHTEYHHYRHCSYLEWGCHHTFSSIRKAQDHELYLPCRGRAKQQKMKYQFLKWWDELSSIYAHNQRKAISKFSVRNKLPAEVVAQCRSYR